MYNKKDNKLEELEFEPIKFCDRNEECWFKPEKYLKFTGKVGEYIDNTQQDCQHLMRQYDSVLPEKLNATVIDFLNEIHVL